MLTNPPIIPMRKKISGMATRTRPARLVQFRLGGETANRSSLASPGDLDRQQLGVDPPTIRKLRADRVHLRVEHLVLRIARWYRIFFMGVYSPKDALQPGFKGTPCKEEAQRPPEVFDRTGLA
jgi:hypothetical protein